MSNKIATREEVVASALTWLNTPYLHQGFVRGAEGGVDCCMILIGVYRPLGLLPADLDPRPYPMQWHLHRDTERYLDWFYAHATQVERPQPGDVALYKFGRTVSHSGIVVDDTNIVHAYREAGAVIKTEMRSLDERIHSFWSLF